MKSGALFRYTPGVESEVALAQRLCHKRRLHRATSQAPRHPYRWPAQLPWGQGTPARSGAQQPAFCSTIAPIRKNPGRRIDTTRVGERVRLLWWIFLPFPYSIAIAILTWSPPFCASKERPRATREELGGTRMHRTCSCATWGWAFSIIWHLRAWIGRKWHVPLARSAHCDGDQNRRSEFARHQRQASSFITALCLRVSLCAPYK